MYQKIVVLGSDNIEFVLFLNREKTFLMNSSHHRQQEELAYFLFLFIFCRNEKKSTSELDEPKLNHP